MSLDKFSTPSVLHPIPSALTKVNDPVVMTLEEDAAVLSLLNCTPQLITKNLYGSGLRREQKGSDLNIIHVPWLRAPH